MDVFKYRTYLDQNFALEQSLGRIVGVELTAWIQEGGPGLCCNEKIRMKFMNVPLMATLLE